MVKQSTWDIPMRFLLSHAEGARVLQTISNRLPFFSETDTTIARFFLTRPEQAIRLSSSELPGAIGVSEASVFRFLNRIGYSYNALKQDLVKFVERKQLFALQSEPEWKQPEPIVSTTVKSIRSLSEAFAYLDASEVEKAAKALIEADCIHVYGMGPVSAPIAEIVSDKFNRLGCTAVIHKSVQKDLGVTHLGQTENVIFVISHSGANEELLGAVTEHVKGGGTAIALSNYEASPIAEAATIRLITGVTEQSVQMLALVPRMAQIMAVEILLETVIQLQRAGQDADKTG